LGSIEASTSKANEPPSPEDEEKYRSWKKKSFKNNDLTMSDQTERRATITSEDDEDKRRSWKIKSTGVHNPKYDRMSEISNFYINLKKEAEQVNSEELIEKTILENKDKLIENLKNARMELVDEGEGEMDEEEEKRERMRIETINEIMLSERYYVRDLDLIVNNFLKPMQSANIIPQDKIDSIFSNIELILKVNKEIRDNLVADFKATDTIQLMHVGQIFLTMIDYLRIYAIYSSNQNNSITTLTKLCNENKQFATFLQEKEQKPECKRVNLQGYLIKPIQRICKYPLLFRELLKVTPAEHTDHENIGKCLKKVQQVADFVNEKKRENQTTWQK